jgi:hypothetical protein
VATNITQHFKVNNVLFDLQHGFSLNYIVGQKVLQIQLLGLFEDLHLSRNLIQAQQTEYYSSTFYKNLIGLIT